MKINGQISWADIYSYDIDATQKFFEKTLDIKVKKVTGQDDMDYRLIQAKKAVYPVAGIMQIRSQERKKGLLPHSTLYFTVKNYDEAHKKAIANGAKVILEPRILKNMKFGAYLIPGGGDIMLVQYGVKK